MLDYVQRQGKAKKEAGEDDVMELDPFTRAELKKAKQRATQFTLQKGVSEYIKGPRSDVAAQLQAQLNMTGEASRRSSKRKSAKDVGHNIEERTSEGHSSRAGGGVRKLLYGATVSNADLASPKDSKGIGESFLAESNMRELGLKKKEIAKLSLQYNERNLVKVDELADQLSMAERELLAELIKQEKLKYQDIANERFDSKNNWSIMIKPECNDERNEIMRKFKYQQFMKHNLREFVRKQRDIIISEKKRKEEEEKRKEEERERMMEERRRLEEMKKLVGVPEVVDEDASSYQGFAGADRPSTAATSSG